MKDNTDYMDKAIKEKFEGHEVPVPSHLWSSIESNLPPGPNNTGGNFFSTNPFMLSILLISTVLVGTYLYHSSTKTDNQTSITEKKQVATPLSNSISTIQSVEKDKTSSTNSNTDSETIVNSILFKNNEKNHTGIGNHTSTSNHNQSFSNTTTHTRSTDNIYSTQEQNKNRSVSNKNSRQQTINNNKGNNNITAHQSNKKNLSNTSSGNVFSKETNKNNTHSASTTSNTKSNPSESTNSTSTRSATNIHATTQASNSTTSKNSERVNAHANSTKQSTSAFMQESDSFNKIDSSNSNTISDKNTSTKNTQTNNITTASAYTQDVQNTPIGSTTAISNSISNLANPAEIATIYNQDTHNYETTESESVSANKRVVSNTNTSQTSSTNTSLDSANSNTLLENYFHTNSTIGNDTTFAANNSTEKLLLKTDSTTEHPDSISPEKQPKTIEVKSSEEEKNKKSLFLSRCSFDGYATPALGYIHLSPNSNQEGISESAKERNQNARTGFGITTGIRANYALTQKIEIGIGFQYSSLSQQSSFIQRQVDSSYITYQGHNQIDSTYDPIRDTTIFTSHFVVTDSATINLTSSNVKSYTDTYQNFSIPIHIAYGYSITNKLSLLARTSLLINYQTSSTTYFNGSDSTIIGYHSNKNLSLGGSFSIGCYYQFAKRYSIFAEPIVTYYFSNVFDKQVPFKQTQLMLGLQTGIRLSF